MNTDIFLHRIDVLDSSKPQMAQMNTDVVYTTSH